VAFLIISSEFITQIVMNFPLQALHLLGLFFHPGKAALISASRRAAGSTAEAAMARWASAASVSAIMGGVNR
jgi:hypothetical protein